MEEYNIKKTLRQCKKAAAKGYEIAVKQYHLLDSTLRDAEQRIADTLAEINSSTCVVSEASDSLVRQLLQIKDSMGFVSAKLSDDLADKKQDLSKFTITLFGRTMAGKSTLMEVLTQGDGSTIGNGSQRTTKDVRPYTWNNLEITDVPGIGAFRGDNDEQIALETARKADLVIFLLSDDAPQAVEGDFFSTVVSLGKPIICILNVKCAIRSSDGIESIRRKIGRAFNNDRLEQIKDQFLCYADAYGQDWSDIPFINVHLKAAYEATRTTDVELAEEYTCLSNIDALKSSIISEVNGHGNFYRAKNFIDIVSVPTLDIYESFLYQHAINKNLYSLIIQKRKQFCEWVKKYMRDNTAAIESFVNGISSELQLEIPDFAEEHFEDENVEAAWRTLLFEKKIDEQTDAFANALVQKAEDQLKELEREVSNEFEYVSTLMKKGNLSLPQMHAIFDAKKAWNWGALIVGGGLSITAGILWVIGSAASGPVGWIALGVSALGALGSLIFTSKEKRNAKARRKLESALEKNVCAITDSIKGQLLDLLHEIEHKQLTPVVSELERIGTAVLQLSNTQIELIDKIQPTLLEQNKQLLKGALQLVSPEWLFKDTNKISAVGRIPGKLMIAYTVDKAEIPERRIVKIKKLLQENFILLSGSVSCSTTIGCTEDDLLINDRTAQLLKKEMDPHIINRVRIAEQFSSVYISNDKEAKQC